jgi:hypothetical protein
MVVLLAVPLQVKDVGSQCVPLAALVKEQAVMP